MSAEFAIVKDPRLATPLEAHVRQFNLLKELHDALGSLNGAVNRIRRLRRQIGALTGSLGEAHGELAGKAKAAVESLLPIESVLVDVNRQTPRDVLRNPAGLNDTLVDLINTVAMSDREPTAQAEAVSRELMARVAGEIGKLEAIDAGAIAEINRMAAERAIGHVTGR